ncbi:MAG: putative toxin-antitoxin system toxin component, PIN family [Pseudomonadota bacterium]|nr:putative toxin-antitoxin system toxin component, PIN family [Pseudomonadota bacterium]
MRVVLDTHVLVSGLAFPSDPFGRLASAWRAGALELVVSEFLLDELARTLQALSARTGFTAQDVQDFLDLLRVMACVVELEAAGLVRAQAPALRDPGDVPILATFMASGADYLVTGDKNLLALTGSCAILTPTEFCVRHAP